AGAVGTEEPDQLSFFYGKGDLLDRVHIAVLPREQAFQSTPQPGSFLRHAKALGQLDRFNRLSHLSDSLTHRLDLPQMTCYIYLVAKHLLISVADLKQKKRFT